MQLVSGPGAAPAQASLFRCCVPLLLLCAPALYAPQAATAVSGTPTHPLARPSLHPTPLPPIPCRERLRQLPDSSNITIAYPDEVRWGRVHCWEGVGLGLGCSIDLICCLHRLPLPPRAPPFRCAPDAVAYL